MALKLASDDVRRGFLARIRREIRPLACELHRQYLNRAWGMDIGEDCMVSFSSRLDRTYPRGIHIGDSTAINFGVVVLAHDYTRNMHVDTWIGRQCQIGAHAFIMPGVRIGDNCVVAPASVVMRDVPPNTLVAGNPARPIEKDIQTGRWGKLIRAEEPANTEEAGSAVAPPPVEAQSA
jgi:acetyltransferase-like isoleucine patch superfamily enzyme